MLMAIPFCWLAVWLCGAPATIHLGKDEILGLSYFIGGVTIVAFVAWTYSIRCQGVGRTAIWLSAMPVVGLALGLALERSLAPLQWLGAAIATAAIVASAGRGMEAAARRPDNGS